MLLATVNALADKPRSDQGEVDAKPKPAPSVKRIRYRETATKAPAKMAPHEVAVVALQRAASSWAIAEAVSIMSGLQRCEHIASNRMMGSGTPNIHSKIPRPIESPLQSSMIVRGVKT
jgi:hypothetical protein